MSGSNDPDRQAGQPNQGGQPQQGDQSPQNNHPQQGGQPQQHGKPNQGQPQQRGQPRQTRGGQAPQGQAGGRRPPNGGGTLAKLRKPEPSSYLKGIVGTMAIAAVLLGVLVFLVGSIGGFAVLPGAVDDAREMAQTNGGQQQNGFSAQPSVDTSVEQINTALANSHQLLLGYLTAWVAPFFAFLMAPVFGAVVAFRMSVPERTKQLTAGVGTAIGAAAFVVIVTFIASMVIPDATAFAAGQNSQAAGMAASSLGVSTELGSVQFLNLLINSVLVGLLTGAAGVGTVYSIENFLST